MKKNLKFLLRVEKLEEKIEKAHQNYLTNGELSAFKRIPVVNVLTPNGREMALTPYGRERVGICSGGYFGCEGEAKMRDKGDHKAPMCENCFKSKDKPMVECSLCGMNYFEYLSCNPLPLLQNLEENRVCPICDDVITTIRVLVYKEIEKEKAKNGDN